MENLGFESVYLFKCSNISNVPAILLSPGGAIVNKVDMVSTSKEHSLEKQFKEMTTIPYAKYMCYCYELNCVPQKDVLQILIPSECDHLSGD
jgi:hypothetical protein